MNKYLEIGLTPDSHGGGSFTCKANFRLDNFQTTFQGVDVKIDTGCSLSTIPVKRLQVSDSLCKSLKTCDIDDSRDYVLSYGVETGGISHPRPITRQEKIDCPAMKFRHNISDFMINKVTIPAKNIYLNYNRSGNILIGMDILKSMICHWGVSRKNGKLVMLCCNRTMVDKEFYEAMKEHFGLISIIQ